MRLDSVRSLEYTYDEMNARISFEKVKLPNTILKACDKLNKGENLDEVLFEVGTYYKIEPNSFNEELIDEGYLSNNLDSDTIVCSLENYNPKELKKILKKHKLKKS